MTKYDDLLKQNDPNPFDGVLKIFTWVIIGFLIFIGFITLFS